MKMTIRQNTDAVDVETEKPDDLYQLGRIAAKFKKSAHNYPEGQRTVELTVLEVIKCLAD